MLWDTLQAGKGCRTYIIWVLRQQGSMNNQGQVILILHSPAQSSSNAPNPLSLGATLIAAFSTATLS